MSLAMYPTVLSDEQWGRIEAFTARPDPRGLHGGKKVKGRGHQAACARPSRTEVHDCFRKRIA